MRKGTLPLVSVMNGVATGIVLAVAAAIVGGIFFMIRLMSDDSDKYKQIKEFAEALLGSSSGRAGGADASAEAASPPPASWAAAGEAFSEPCPACGATVTHEHAECPSCGLRLQ